MEAMAKYVGITHLTQTLPAHLCRRDENYHERKIVPSHPFLDMGCYRGCRSPGIRSLSVWRKKPCKFGGIIFRVVTTRHPYPETEVLPPPRHRRNVIVPEWGRSAPLSCCSRSPLPPFFGKRVCQAPVQEISRFLRDLAWTSCTCAVAGP